MCFFTSQSKKARDIAKKYGRQMDIIEMARQILAEQEAERQAENQPVNIYSTHLNDGMYVSPGWAHPFTVIVSGSDQLQVMNWGLIPWYATPEQREQYIRQSRYRNARADRLFTSPMWKRIIRNRCVIPVTGFFEPHENSDKSKQPYYIERKDKEMFSIAGLYDEWQNLQTGEKSLSFVLITVVATPKLGKIHNGGDHPNRMPLILTDEQVKRWLDPALEEQADIEKFLVTPDIDQEITAWPVRNKFDRSNPYDPSLIEPVPAQQELDLDNL